MAALAEGKKQLGLASFSSPLSAAGFLLPAAKVLAFAHANRNQSLLPVLPWLSPGCHLDVQCTAKTIAPAALYSKPGCLGGISNNH